MLSEVLEETADVVTVKFVLDCPAGTVTLAGTCAAALLLERLTTAPFAGATPVQIHRTCGGRTTNRRWIQ
jgi:hypothetical protein